MFKFCDKYLIETSAEIVESISWNVTSSFVECLSDIGTRIQYDDEPREGNGLQIRPSGWFCG